MTEHPGRRNVVLGLFVSVALAALAATILGIGDLHDTFTRKVEVSAVFPDVGGLQAGDNVWYAGVKIGVVRRLTLESADAVRVAIQIDRDAAAEVPSDVLARIGTDGLIGNRIVVLSGGTPGAAPTADGAELGVAAALSTDDLLATLQRNNENLLAITADVKALTARLRAGEGTAGKLLGEDALFSTLTATAADARSVGSDLRAFAGGLDRPGRLPNQLLTDEALVPSLAASAADLERVTRRAAAVLDGLERAAADPGTPVGTLLHDRPAGADLRAVLENLNVGSERLAEDLEAAQHSLLLRGFFRKKARREAEEAARAVADPRPAADPQP